MTAHAVKLKVIAGAPKDCSFWLEVDGWNGPRSSWSRAKKRVIYVLGHIPKLLTFRATEMSCDSTQVLKVAWASAA